MRYFFRLRFGIDFAWIFKGSTPKKSLPFSRKINDFHKIGVIEKVPKTTESWLRFRTSKNGKIDKTRC